MLLDFAVFAVSLAVLLAAARFFTVSAERIGLALGMSPFAIGVMIVSAGTSLPEMVSSVVAVTRGTSEIVVGNVLGANLSNLLLVMGVVALAAPRQVRLGDQYILIDLHYLLGAALLLALSLRDGVITRVEGAFLLAGYGVYLLYLMKEGKIEKDLTVGVDARVPAAAQPFPLGQVGILVVTGALIYLGARSTVASLESIAGRLGVSTRGPGRAPLRVDLSSGRLTRRRTVSGPASRPGRAPRRPSRA